jgi:hypothetical protein
MNTKLQQPSQILRQESDVPAAGALRLRRPATGTPLSLLGRGLPAMIVAALLVTPLVLVTIDLDRRTRGSSRLPAEPLVSVRASIAHPPGGVRREPT